MMKTNCFERCRKARIRERAIRGELRGIDDMLKRLSPGIASADGVRQVSREDVAELIARKADMEQERTQSMEEVERTGVLIDKALEGEENERRRAFCTYYYRYGYALGESAMLAGIPERTAYRWKKQIRTQRGDEE